MFRLDEGNEKTVAILADLVLAEKAETILDNGAPIEVCDYCHERYGFEDDVEAPPLEAWQGRSCIICGETDLEPEREEAENA